VNTKLVNEIESARWAEVVAPPNDVNAQLDEAEVPAAVPARRHDVTVAVETENPALCISQHREVYAGR